MANHQQEPWKQPLAEFIDSLYQARFPEPQANLATPAELTALPPSVEKNIKSNQSSISFESIMQQLDRASLFDLFRLHVAIGHELNNSKRLIALKQKLHVGMQVYWYDDTTNRLAAVTIIALNPKTAEVVDTEKHKRYSLPYFMINIDEKEVRINKKDNKLDRHQLQVGERVGFSKDGIDYCGIILRLNPKTVTLDIGDGRRWRVSYSFLHRVTDMDTA